MSDDGELVLGLPRADVPGGLGWRGVQAVDLEPYLAAIAGQATFRPRAEVEDDPSWKQVIPYLALRDGPRVFLMRRTRAGGDARLHERHSIGVGGHVNPGDGDPLAGLAREWREELAADFMPDFQPLGVLNDDDDPVGAVHLGLVFSADAAGRPVRVRETEKLEGRFATLAEVAQVAPSLETWSSLLFDFLTIQGPPSLGER
ncbi:MAG TPA: NUDIX domain-containing protein [Candidatus Limnocylindria bacterium]|nr:NUDIX domain-containing protein [Candidatus Limnocylindria bacterium]